jgi:hypothetical protein
LTDNVNQVDALFDIFYSCHVLTDLVERSIVNFTLDAVGSSAEHIARRASNEKGRPCGLPFASCYYLALNLGARFILIGAFQLFVSLLCG